jgi:hypothetical protein
MSIRRTALIILIGSILLPSSAALRGHAAEPLLQPRTKAAATDQSAEIAALKAEIERLKGMVPDQSHVMKDVAYHFSNLWFAGKAQNWPLAAFYLGETRSHLRWAVRVRPTRRTAAGDIDLAGILDGLDRSSLAALQKTIEAKDAAAFATAYTDTLTGCYACHQASEKPYLRPHVPDAPEGRMIELVPTGH